MHTEPIWTFAKPKSEKYIHFLLGVVREVTVVIASALHRHVTRKE